MLTRYIDAAMQHAHYETLSDGTWYGEIPELQGVWADADSREDCERELREVLEDWIVFRLANNFPLPTVEGISLNPAHVT